MKYEKMIKFRDEQLTLFGDLAAALWGTLRENF